MKIGPEPRPGPVGPKPNFEAFKFRKTNRLLTSKKNLMFSEIHAKPYRKEDEEKSKDKDTIQTMISCFKKKGSGLSKPRQMDRMHHISTIMDRRSLPDTA